MRGFRGVARLLCLAAMFATAFCARPDAAAAVTVTKTADSDDKVCNADCSLREAIEAAAPGEAVTLPASATPYEVLDENDTLVIEKDLTIAGAGARQTEVTAPGTQVRPFTIVSPALESVTVTIRDLSITGGDGSGAKFGGQGGGVLAAKGAAIAGPKLLLERVRVAGNTATVASKAQAVGGGVTSDGIGTTLTIRDSLIVGNKAVGAGESQATGGGVATFASSVATIENTTIVGNEAIADSPTGGQSSRAGGVSVGAGSSLLNVTIYGNAAKRSTPAAILGRGGGLSASSSATVRNTVVAGNTADQAGTEDCAAPVTTESQGGNVLPASCGPGSTDRTAADTGLEPLANNGGETDTMALRSGSSALDAGVGCPPPATDQRGLPRPSGVACDSGAFELQSPPPREPPKETPPPTCNGRKATIVGTAGRDRLRGTKKGDVIAALAGNDTIRALRGNDLVCGGKGKDVLRGGPGKDRLLGQKGADRLFGGPGKDKLLGGAGKDRQRQ